MLKQLRPIMTSKAYAQLVKRLNEPGPGRLPAVWEATVMGQLAVMGTLAIETKLPNGKRPDIHFAAPDGFAFIADITTISDRGVDLRNPIDQFNKIIEEEKAALGLPIGGVQLDVREEPELLNSGGSRRRLRLPPHGELRDYVRTIIMPELKRQLDAKQWPLSFVADDGVAGFRLTIAEGPHSTGSYGCYAPPTVVDVNPLYHKLKEKAEEQLRDVPDLAGIIACDGDCAAMTSDKRHGAVGTDQIVQHFLKNFPHIGFVMVLTIKAEQMGWMQGRKETLTLQSHVWTRPDISPRLKEILVELATKLPTPINSATNGAYRAVESGYGRGHGVFGMSPPTGIKIGARHLMELLSGRRTVEEFNREMNFRSSIEPADPSERNMFPNPFESALAAGRLPIQITVEETGENGRDNVLQIEFGDPDPAISPFC
ncbi:hypothetical protein [Sphingobium sp.]|uniref:hypothetical protein n=1 Tax=Sphingobium sp. TaxID=1912891 RepID=UPI0028BEFC30|nr:hypothetical protein [Sphingobium sp.]